MDARRDEDGLWSRVDRSAGPDGCWPWQGLTDKDGYGIVQFRGRKTSPHRASYILAHGDVPPGLYVLHSCDNRPCCNPSHLRAGTAADNAHDAMSRGRHCRGEVNGVSKLTDAQVVEIRTAVASGEKLAAVGARYGIDFSTVSDIVRGRRWPHVGGPIKTSGAHRTITPEQVAQVRAALAAGEGRNAIARRLDLSRPTVSNIAHGRTHAG